MSRASRFVLILALAAVAAFVWRRSPPKGVDRLDSGSDNGTFSLFDGDSRLFYTRRGFAHDIVNSVELASGRTASRRLWGRRLEDIGLDGSRILLITRGKDRSPKPERFAIMSVNGDDLSTRREEPRAAADRDEMLFFDSPYASSTEAAKVPSLNDHYATSARLAPGGVRVRLRVKDKYGPEKLYPTPTAPSAVVYVSADSIAVAYPVTGASRVEEIMPFTGRRRVVVDLDGTVESMGMAGADGLVAIRAVRDATRLSFVSLSQSKQLLDLPWSKGGSTLLGADPVRRKLYFSMAVKDPDGGRQQTAWAVPTDHASLREAAKFFSAMHAWPDLRWKLIGHSVEILIAVFLLCAALFFLGTLIDI